MATNEEAVSEQSQMHLFNDTSTFVGKNIISDKMNDSLEKAAFGSKHLRRRSSLFFKNILPMRQMTEVNDAVPDDISNFDCHSNSYEKALEEKVVTSDSKRRTSVRLQKPVYRTRSKAAMRKFEVICESPPLSLKPILLSAVNKAARRITMKAKGWNKHRRVHFHSVLNIRDITPRSGKIPGVVKMPDSPPIVKGFSTSKIAGDSTEHCIPITQPVILQDTTTNMFRNETVRFLPAISETFHCHSEKENIAEECPETNDESDSGVVNIVASDLHLSPLFFGIFFKDDDASQPEEKEIDNCMNAKKVVNYSKASNTSEMMAAVKRTKRHIEKTAVTWVRGDRLRSLSVGMKEVCSLLVDCDINENKENMNLNMSKDKKTDGIRQCNEAFAGLEHSCSSLLVIPRAGPKAKVQKWLQNIPNQWDHLIDRGDAFMSDRQEQIVSKDAMQSDNMMMEKQSSHRRSFGGSASRTDDLLFRFVSPLLKRQRSILLTYCVSDKHEKGNKRRRRSLLLQKAVRELPASKRRQTILVGSMKGNLWEGTNSFPNFSGVKNALRSQCSVSASFCSQNTGEMNDDVVFLSDQELNSASGKSLTFCEKKMRATNTVQTITNKSEAAMNISSICSDQLIDAGTNCIPKHEKKPVLMDEMDFAPFPSISNVGYAEVTSLNYDLPCGLRRNQISNTISYNNNTFQMSFRRRSFDGERSWKKKVAGANSCILLRPRSSRKKWSKHGRWKSLIEELQRNIWSEALRPLEIDELIVDGSTVRKLCDWINMWKERLQKSRNPAKSICYRLGFADVGVTSRRKRRDSDSFDSFGSDEEGEQLCNTAIIYGHCGSGKTSLLKCKLQGATHSHKFHNLLKYPEFPMTTMVNQMFFRNEKNERKMVEDSIILVDDCDVIYDKHDDGFWPALRTLCKEAHTPVVIVCEDISFVRKRLGLEMPVLIFPLIRPEVQTVSLHLQALLLISIIPFLFVLLNRNLFEYFQKLCAALNINVCSDVCCALAEQYKGDLRACINQLQFYSGEDSNNSLGMLMERLKSGEKIEFETFPKKCHLISYNVILRYDHSFEPGAVLSSTDREEEDLHAVKKNDTHVAVEVTRSVLPAIEYFPLSDVILDYMPYLCIMNRASRAKMPTSRRGQHYFDELHGDSRIDSSGTLKNTLIEYRLLTY
uniref:ATPase_AAA_core domain-containing protein n=1 Tax=Elaeophora elaphi TaxID=1147741 RepID=A0A0R3S4U5_9BILA